MHRNGVVGGGSSPAIYRQVCFCRGGPRRLEVHGAEKLRNAGKKGRKLLAAERLLERRVTRIGSKCL